MLLVYPAAMAARLVRPAPWIISERPDQARDNGYCFFRYLKQKHPEQAVRYIIDPKGKDFAKIAPYGKAIPFNGWKHYFYFCYSKIHISSHVGGCVPYDNPMARRMKKAIGFRDVFLPHGVSYGISEFCLAKYTQIDLFVCSGKPEYDNVLANYGYTPQQVAYTGFPRLDGWYDIHVNPKQVVLMPTWRLYLAQRPDTVIRETTFFRTYASLLRSEALKAILQRYDLQLVFFLHNDMRKYVDAFQTDCERIEIVYRDETYDIQELLKSAALLITDYSSVHFDFAYMGKPVIYYPFDREEFFRRQYRQSTFDAEKDGFGPVALTESQLIAALEEAANGGFAVAPEYDARMHAFYQLHDSQNCDRVYEAIRRMRQK
ncbi:MAG: CDP-glycerol glycerophosphotransferase family protein [Clostridia bacterium]|nr:CDP-glycerol glycerophosphotransferase family protein [Clostridia bacterium]